MKAKNANIELIRIVAMVLVVVHHFFRHGGGTVWPDFASKEYVVFWSIDAFAFVCVNLFVLVSGYCLADARFKMSRIVRLWIEVEFYSVFCTLVGKLLGQDISAIRLLKAFVPFTTEAYWYVTAYAVLLCFSPFINLLIGRLNKRQHLALIMVISLIYIVLPTLFVWMRDLVTTGMDYEWFIVLYIIGAYIKKYGIPCSLKASIIGYFSCSFVTGLARVPLGILSNRIIGSYILAGLFFRYNSITVAMASIFLFWFLLSIHIRNERSKTVILRMAPFSFAVYLIHDNSSVRELLWSTLPMEKLYSDGIIIYLIGLIIIVPLIYIGCCMIENMRTKVFTLIGYQEFLHRVDLKFEKMMTVISVRI